MKLWTISDLHLRQRDAMSLLKPGEIPDADACVVAGDLCEGVQLSLHWLGRVVRPRMPVVFVPGNHEFYGSSIAGVRRTARMIADALDVTLLDDGAAVIGDVRFVGGTLWTDYALQANASDPIQRGKGIQAAMTAAKTGLADHSQIDLEEVRGNLIPRHFKPRDALALHEMTRRYIDEALSKPFDGATVVVTHHAPHPGSVADIWKGHPVTPAFVSDLSDLILRHQPEAWIHGHVHHRFDYAVGRTRIICNPRGYDREARFWDWSKVVEISPHEPEPDRLPSSNP